jgi:tetratricopeptide (TPR) repeat protein
LIWGVSQPEERTGPPVEQQPGAAGGPVESPHGQNDPALREKIDELRTSVSNGTGSNEDLLLLANLLYDQGARTASAEPFAEASVLYEQYLLDDPENPDARTDYAFTLSRIGEVDNAIDQLHRVRNSHPEHQNSAFNLAIMYKEKDMPDSVLYFMGVTAEIDSTTRTGKAALEVLQAYSGAH